MRLVGRNRRRYGGYLVHAAIVLLAIGIAGSSAYQTVRERSLQPGQSMKVAGYTLTYQSLQNRQLQNAQQTSAVVSTSHAAARTSRPSIRGRAGSPSSSPRRTTCRSTTTRATSGDVYTIADGIAKNGTLDLKVLVKPLVNLVWAAGFVFVFGALVAMWPDAVEQRRLADRYAAVPV